ncbi:hypothetical protein [Gloeobacter kilaueensis]|uniref:Uncharacterized protein n=1 Tax=Gloeobacter kilaueensis (strain ATCC BAA-2537 / CCAP 1431/1 / ULC 316 / JS1) TaxID=1183438 RepID=U5QC07_GLOK1|nr:hypothetical protein [Gloeobacter kilaueensis]AGY56437.1 hypothetical protein GKIL_0190 [Gloeobacter kilaueensis JS1]
MIERNDAKLVGVVLLTAMLLTCAEAAPPQNLLLEHLAAASSGPVQPNFIKAIDPGPQRA